MQAKLEMDPREDPVSATSAPLPQDSTTMILAAIEQSRTSLLMRIDLAKECNLIRNYLDKIRGRMTEYDYRISATEDLAATHVTSIAELQRTVQTLVAKSDDAENQLRQNNVRVLDLPEGEHLEGFAEDFFKNLLGFTDVPPPTWLKEPIGCPRAEPFLRTSLDPFWSAFSITKTGTGSFLKLANTLHSNTAMPLFSFSLTSRPSHREIGKSSMTSVNGFEIKRSTACSTPADSGSNVPG